MARELGVISNEQVIVVEDDSKGPLVGSGSYKAAPNGVSGPQSEGACAQGVASCKDKRENNDMMMLQYNLDINE